VSLRRAVDSVDHLILGAATLADGVAFVRDRLGVTARPGVRLPGAATENALVALGPRSYLEVLAPADDADEPAPGLAPLRSLAAPALWGWAIATDAGGARAERADQLGVVHAARAADRHPLDGGSFVRWRNLGVQLALGPAAPFFIEWSAHSPHPAAQAPTGGRLRAITVRHPDPDAARAALAKLGFDVDVARGDAPGLAAELETLDGELLKL
jgi:hypothetical protein